MGGSRRDSEGTVLWELLVEGNLSELTIEMSSLGGGWLLLRKGRLFTSDDYLNQGFPLCSGNQNALPNGRRSESGEEKVFFRRS